jgi:hypothetical protein
LRLRNKKFWFVSVAIIFVVNATPYWKTRGALAYDGVELAGFPFRFYSMSANMFGGSINRMFSPALLVADIFIGIAVAFVLGYLWTKITGNRARNAL